MPYDSLNLIDGDVLTSDHIRHIEGGLRDIENNIDSMRISLINILKDKGVYKPEDTSFEDLYREITYLQKPVIPDYEYSEEVADIRNVESGKIKIVFNDSNGGAVGFRIAATTGVIIDWGDGESETVTTTPTAFKEVLHSYEVGTGAYLDGTRTQFIVTIEPLVENGITGFAYNANAGRGNAMLAYASKDIYYKYLSSDTFASCLSLEYIYIVGGSYGVAENQFALSNFCDGDAKLKTVYIENLLWNNVTSMSYAFRGCSVLSNIYLGESWDSINCTSFVSSFSNCKQIKSIPSFKTNSANNMSNCFYGCSMLETVSGSWDLSACSSFNTVFHECSSLIEVPILNNMYNITSMSSCFCRCTSLVKFNENQGNFNTENNKNFYSMFLGCAKLEEIPEIDFSEATNIIRMFNGCSALYIMQNVLNLPQLIGTSTVYNHDGEVDGLDGLFAGCTSLTTAPTIIAPQVLNAFHLFYGCSSLVNVPDIDLPSVKRAHEMFRDCASLINAPHHINLPSAQNVKGMFNNCVSLRNGPEYDVGDKLSFPEAIWAHNLFNGCTSLVNAPKAVELNKAVNIYNIFNGCANMVIAPTNITAPLAQQAYQLFYGCAKLTTSPSRISLPEAINAYDMFYMCSSLLVCPELDLPKATNLREMFFGCQALTSTLPYEFPCATSISGFYRYCTSLVTIAPIKVGGASCDMNYFFFESSSVLNTAYFPEITSGGKLTWNTHCFRLDSGNTFRKFENTVDCTGGTAYVDSIFSSLYIEEIKIKNFSGALTVTNRANLTSVRLITPSKNIGNLNFSGCNLSGDALNQLLTDLPSVPTPRTINIRNNPGALACDTSIATAKNWVVTIV